MRTFTLDDKFIAGYADRPVAWGPLGEFVYLRTYSRRIESENRNEKWFERRNRRKSCSTKFSTLNFSLPDGDCG